MHIGLLTVNGEKMSKSLGNIINVKDLLKKWDPEVVRLFFVQTHYRSPPDFNEKALKNAEKGLIRIHRLKEKLESLCDKTMVDKLNEKGLTTGEKEYLRVTNDFKSEFETAMDDDFNTPQAVSVIFEFVNKSNRYLEENSNPDKALCGYALDTLTKLSNILTLFQPSLVEGEVSDDKVLLEKLQKVVHKYKKDIKEKSIEKLVDLLLEVREEARKKKDWNTADNIRKELDDIGFEIQDTSDGPVWRKK
jgi:cysteinyl-tRNA synthetase